MVRSTRPRRLHTSNGFAELEEKNDAQAECTYSAIEADGLSRPTEFGADCQCDNAKAISTHEVRA